MKENREGRLQLKEVVGTRNVFLRWEISEYFVWQYKLSREGDIYEAGMRENMKEGEIAMGLRIFARKQL